MVDLEGLLAQTLPLTPLLAHLWGRGTHELWRLLILYTSL